MTEDHDLLNKFQHAVVEAGLQSTMDTEVCA